MIGLGVPAALGATTAPALSAGEIRPAAIRPAAASAPGAPAQTSRRPRSRGPRRPRIDGIVNNAKGAYYFESRGTKLHAQLRRIAHDPTLLGALARGDYAAAQTAADNQLASPINHTAHVTRIAVVRGSRQLVNAVVNSDGTFVVAPGKRVLRLHGRRLGTLLVSIQDIIGFIKIVHNVTGAQVVVRGSSGQVRVSLGPAAAARLPRSGRVSIAGRRYFVRSFREPGWRGERLTVWILEAH